jgi:hypothetical protein
LSGCRAAAGRRQDRSNRYGSEESMKEERNDFVIGLVLFLIASGIILAVMTYAIVAFQ